MSGRVCIMEWRAEIEYVREHGMITDGKGNIRQMECTISRAEALKLLKKYNKEPFHIQHALTVEGVMRYFAGETGNGEDEEYGASQACSMTLISNFIRNSIVSRRRSFCGRREFPRT